MNIKHIIAATFLASGMAAQNGPASLKTFSIGIRAANFYDLPSYRFDSELSHDMKGLNGDNTRFDIGMDLYLEKQFTPLLGLQAGLRTGGLTGANSREYYKNSFSEGFVDGIFIFSNLNKNRIGKKLDYYAKLGLGYGHFSANRFLQSDNSPNGHTEGRYWEGRPGLGLQYNLNTFLRLELDVDYNIAFNDGFDGYNYGTGSDPYLSTGIGLAYTFGKKAEKPMSSVNFFGPEYFGRDEALIEQEDRVKDSLMQAKLEQASQRVEDLNRVIEDQKKAIANLQEEKNKPAPKAEPETKQAMVFFDFDSAVLSPKAKQQLAVEMTDIRGPIVLTGYADNTGKSSYNQQLMERRANAVKDFLIQVGGLSDSDITIQTASQVKDLKNNDFLNRKVVIQYKEE